MKTLKTTCVCVLAIFLAMTVSEYGYTTDQAVETSKAGLEQCLDKMAENLSKA